MEITANYLVWQQQQRLSLSKFDPSAAESRHTTVMDFEQELLCFKPFERARELFMWLVTADEICLIKGASQLASEKVLIQPPCYSCVTHSH
jgi:hypothetical protein